MIGVPGTPRRGAAPPGCGCVADPCHLERDLQCLIAAVELAADGAFAVTVDPRDGTRKRCIGVGMETLTGRDGAELAGLGLRALLPAREAAHIENGITAMLAGADSVIGMEASLIHRDGTVRRVRATGRVLELCSGPVICVALRDLGERRATRRPSVPDLSVAEQVVEAVITTDRDLQVVTWNSGAETLFGYSRGEVEGRRLDELVCWLMPRDETEAILRSVRDSGAWHGELEFCGRHGQVIRSQARFSRCLDGAGEDGVLAVIYDVTELARSRVQLAQSENRFQQLVERGVTPYLVLVGHEIRYVNPAGAALLGGRDAAELVGAPIFRFLSPDRHRRFVRWLQNVGLGRETRQVVEEHLWRPEAPPVLVELHATPIVFDETAAVQLVLHDITAKNNLLEGLQQAVREQETLLREVHHRVKNNLQVVSSLLRLQGRAVGSADRSWLLRSQERIASIALVHEMLHDARQLDQIDFASYTAKLTHRLLDAHRVERPVELRLNLMCVQVDLDTAAAMGMLLDELVSNAVKHAFRENGAVLTLTVALELDEVALKLTVRDDGDATVQPLDLGDSPSLGLRLVQTLVRQLDGELASEWMGGTVMRVSVPWPRPRDRRAQPIG